MASSGPLRRSGWTAFLTSSIARALLAVVGMLVIWATVPALLGLEPTVVMTGSMEPRLQPGDIVLSRPVPASALQIGQTLLFDDPDQPGHLRLHRFIATGSGHSLTTKGDANPAADSTPVRPDAVRGVASLRIPAIGRPVVWWADGKADRALLAALAALAALVSSFWFKRPPPAEPEAGSGRDHPHPRARDRNPAGRHATGVRSTRRRGDLATNIRSAGGVHRRSRPRRHPRRRLVTVAVLSLAITVVGLSVAASARAASATFAARSATPATSWTAARYFSCGGAAGIDGAVVSYPLDEGSGTTAANHSPYGSYLDGTYTGDFTLAAAPSPCGGARAAYFAGTGDGTGGSGVSEQTADQGRDTFTWEAWFQTSTHTGGKIIGSETSSTGAMSTQYDRHIYMTDSGTLVFGVYPGAIRTVSTAQAYNDGVWHLVDGVLGPAGLQLYVDGRLVAADPSVTSAESYQGYLRVGGGTLAGWPDQPTSSYFQGYISYASGYYSALSSSAISGHFGVGDQTP